MAHNLGSLVFTPLVKALQEKYGSRRQYARLEAGGVTPDRLGPDESAFIGERDGFYMATVGATGWPYVQHRGGPKGFLKVIDDQTIAFTDFRGNKQYISAGNLGSDDRVALIMVDYPGQARLKILGRAQIFEGGRGKSVDRSAPRAGQQRRDRTRIRDSGRSIRLELPSAHHAPLHGGADSRSARAFRTQAGRAGAGKPKAPRSGAARGQKLIKRRLIVQQAESIRISRRRLLAVAGLSAGATLLVRRPLFVNENGIVPTMVNAAARAKIVVHPVRRNISVLEGSGGNIAVLTGPDGKLLVDAGFSVSRPAITSALKSINADPIKRLINTHWHTDHTDGNAWLHDAGAEITAQENTRKRLSVDTRVEGWNWTFPAVAAGALPIKVFATEYEVRHNDTRIALKYYGPAHTDSDVWVNFTDADVVHAGDTWWNGVYPFIDYSTGGSIDGQIRAAEANLATFTNKTIFIPGRGPVGGRSDVAEFRDMLVAIRQNVAALKKQGRSLNETIAAKPTAVYDAKWGQFLITPAMFTGLVYAGV